MNEQHSRTLTSQVPQAEPKKNHHSNEADHQDVINGEGEIFGVILSRSRSVSVQESTNKRADENTYKRKSSAGGRVSLLLSTKRSFSSSSSSGGYCRIHHQHDFIGAHNDDDDMKNQLDGKKHHAQKRTDKKKGNKILTACIRLLGF